MQSSNEVRELMAEIYRRLKAGETLEEIAPAVGLDPTALAAVVESPAFEAWLAR